jgi:4-amino-4-deoxy-L-arabinose transferase-like glycosyltransferase
MLVSRVKENLIALIAQASDALRQWRSPLPLLLLAFVCNTSLWAAVTNIGNPPDEISHFDYIRHLAINHTLPIYGETHYIGRPGLQTHASLPPLYYLLGTPVQMALSNTTITKQMLALRAISVLIGALTVALAYKFGRMLVPTRPAFAFAVAALVGFNPMFTHLSAAVNSDNLINLIYAALLLLLACGLRQRQPSRGWLIGLGALLGAGLITKQSIVMGVFVSALFILFLAWKQRPRFLRALVRYGLWVSTPAVLISAWYFLRNWKLYGNPTGILAGTRPDVYLTHPYQNVGSLWEMISATNAGLPPFRQTIFLGFWGVFDHYEILMPLRVYSVMSLLLMGGLIGLAFWIISSWRNRQGSLIRLRLMLALIGGLILILSIAGVANLSYRIDYQPQGRYLFAALVPVAVAIVGGWEKLAGLLRLKQLVAPLIVVLILTVNLIGLLLALAPAHHNRYLGRQLQPGPTLVHTAPTVQHVYAEAPGQTSFVAQQTEIRHLDMLLNIPAGLRGPLIWRIFQPDATSDSLTAIVQQPPPGLGRYIIEVSSYRFRAGQTYTLKLEAPAITAQRPVLIGDPSALDVGLQVVYPRALNKQTLLRADYLLRSDTTRSLRGVIQRMLYPLDGILLLALATVALAPLLIRPRLVMILLPVMVLTMAVLLPRLRPIPVILPTYEITAVRDLGRPDPDNKSAAVYSGSLDVANCNVISGWAWNANQPNSPINVDIYDGSVVAATVSANIFRSDLINAGIGNGYHGFTCAVDNLLKNGQPHSIRVRFAGTNTDLSETPKTITCRHSRSATGRWRGVAFAAGLGAALELAR